MAVLDLKKTTLKITDGTPTTPNELEIKIGTGNLSYTERRNMEYILDKGALDTVREGDEAPMEVRFDFQWEYVTSRTGGTETIEDALKKTGEAAAWVSSSADACEPYAVDLTIAYDPDCASGDTELITLPDFRWETLEHDLRGAQISATGQCNAKVATAVRSAAV